MSSSSVTDNIWHQTERAEQRDAPTPVTTLYQQPQLLVLGLQLGHHFPQHALQDIRFVRQCREVDLHI